MPVLISTMRNIFVEKIKPLIKTTYRKEVMSPIGGFGGLFHLDVGKYTKPVLVSSTDGVGTKLHNCSHDG